VELTAFSVWDFQRELTPAPIDREWMSANSGLARGCHPLLVANQAGWWILASQDVRAKWNGRSDVRDLKIVSRDTHVVSNFGSGFVTWRLPYVFRTPPGWHLWSKGPANYFVDGAAPAEGIVETDHADEPFTVNWKLTRKGTVHWRAGEPICQLVPIQTKVLETWDPRYRPPSHELLAGLNRLVTQRTADNARTSTDAPYQPRLGYRKRVNARRVNVRPFSTGSGS
jgi:hypothetical protein